MILRNPKIIESIKPILNKLSFKKSRPRTDFFEMKSMEEWAEIERIWKAKHPILYLLREFYYILYRFFSNEVFMIPKRIKWFYQRGKRGYSDCDVWSFDGYLAEIISKGCIHLSKNTHGYPCESSPEEWDKTLKEIAKEFEEYNKIMEFEEGFDKLTREEYDIKVDKMFTLLRKNFGNLWD